MFRAKMLANRRRHVLVLLDALMQVPARETNITCIAQVTFKKEMLHIKTLASRVDLLEGATKDQLFLFNGQLYEQTDGVAMGSPLGPLLANVFMCSTEETLDREGKMPSYYRRYVDATFTIMPNKTSANNFLETLNQCHSSIKFTMEIENNRMLPFLGTRLLNKSTHVETKVYVKPTTPV